MNHTVGVVGSVVAIVSGLIMVVLGLSLVFAFPVMWLWNWLMPEIFGLDAVGFWQAWGLLMLSGLMFRGVGSSK